MLLRLLLLSTLSLTVFSCERIKYLPTVPKEPKSIDRIPSNDSPVFNEVAARSDKDKIEFDFQIHDSKRNLYQMESGAGAVQKVEIYENGVWKEIDASQYKMFPSSVKSCAPKDYCLFLDLSGSMFRNKATIFKEAREFINRKNEFDHIAIIKYGSEAIVACEFTKNKNDLVQALNNPAHDTIDKGTNTPLAYQLFLDELTNHPNNELKAIVFSDFSGFFGKGGIEPWVKLAYQDSIETHRIIYQRNVRRGMYTKKKKKFILDTYNHQYGSSFIVESFSDIGRYLNHQIDENCLTNTFQLHRYKTGINQYRIQLKVKGQEITIEPNYNYLEPSSITNKAAFSLDTINILNIQFDTGSDSLLPQSLIEIEKISRFMIEYPAIRIEVQGHTDNQGPLEYNTDLSQRRAYQVCRKLISMGVNESRLQAKGFGYTVPVATNNTPEGRQKNRRTEFIVIK